jgi:soluble lytic murein transglycosylase
LNPSINIPLGGAFYKELSQKFADSRPQIYAAYNAGSQTVENWVARRLVEDPILFTELIPYQETKDYVKNVWRNEMVYDYLLQN